MTEPQADNKRADARPARFQYTLRGLLALTTAVAIACAVFFTMPRWVSGLVTVCVLISAPAVLTVMLIYGRGYTRTFAIGALIPAGLSLSLFAPSSFLYLLATQPEAFVPEGFDSLPTNIAFLIFLNVYLAVLLGNGLLAVWVRRWVERGQGSSGPQSPAQHEGSATGDIADNSAGASDADPLAPDT